MLTKCSFTLLTLVLVILFILFLRSLHTFSCTLFVHCMEWVWIEYIVFVHLYEIFCTPVSSSPICLSPSSEFILQSYVNPKSRNNKITNNMYSIRFRSIQTGKYMFNITLSVTKIPSTKCRASLFLWHVRRSNLLIQQSIFWIKAPLELYIGLHLLRIVDLWPEKVLCFF